MTRRVNRPELLQVLLREGGAQGRHRLVDAVLVELQHIEVALHHQGAVLHGALGPVEAEEGLALVEEGRVPGVEVLGLAVSHDPAAEGHEPPPGIVDGDGQAVAEEVDLGAALAAAGQPRLLQQLAGEVQAPQMGHQRIPAVRGHPEARLGDEGAFVAPPVQVGPGLCMALQLALVEGLGGLQRRAQAGLQVHFGRRPLPALGQVDARGPGQLLQGLGEGHALALHEPGEGVAVLAAAEAVVEAPVGHHLEAGAALRVEGAEAHVGRALLAQLHRLAHQGQQVRGVPDALDDFAVTHAPGIT